MDLKFDHQGLLPAIVQDTASGQVLMLAYMNAEALNKTLETGETWFWSRSRQELWHKGATSGNLQTVEGIHYDCDADALLVRVHPAGPACHTGQQSCFYRKLDKNIEVKPGPVHTGMNTETPALPEDEKSRTRTLNPRLRVYAAPPERERGD